MDPLVGESRRSTNAMRESGEFRGFLDDLRFSLDVVIDSTNQQIRLKSMMKLLQLCDTQNFLLHLMASSGACNDLASSTFNLIKTESNVCIMYLAHVFLLCILFDEKGSLTVSSPGKIILYLFSEVHSTIHNSPDTKQFPSHMPIVNTPPRINNLSKKRKLSNANAACENSSGQSNCDPSDVMATISYLAKNHPKLLFLIPLRQMSHDITLGRHLLHYMLINRLLVAAALSTSNQGSGYVPIMDSDNSYPELMQHINNRGHLSRVCQTLVHIVEKSFDMTASRSIQDLSQQSNHYASHGELWLLLGILESACYRCNINQVYCKT
jgi:hypothetical protein